MAKECGLLGFGQTEKCAMKLKRVRQRSRGRVGHPAPRRSYHGSLFSVLSVPVTPSSTIITSLGSSFLALTDGIFLLIASVGVRALMRRVVDWRGYFPTRRSRHRKLIGGVSCGDSTNRLRRHGSSHSIRETTVKTFSCLSGKVRHYTPFPTYSMTNTHAPASSPTIF